MENTGRASGVLLPIFSLPSNYGIGTFGKEAYNFVDQLKNSKQKYWQILPLCPTGFGDSPYQSFSTFAGNPYFIDLDILIKERLLSKEECNQVDFGSNSSRIDYEKLRLGRYPLLKKAFAKSKHHNKKEYKEFLEKNASWLGDYCLYMAVKSSFNDVSWWEWDEDIKFRRPEAVQRYKKDLADEMEFHSFLQYYFTKQWNTLKEYANKNGIKIVGDIPIYVAMDSADVWADPALFQLDENLNPTAVAGVPPDYFSTTGQLWGNPLYDWERHEKDQYSWWIKRIEYAAKLYDTVRIDHFKGFDGFWSVPYGEKTAVNGQWCKGPGIDLFRQIKKQLGDVDIIAEDLGVQTDSLHALLGETGYPGMKVIQFGFDKTNDSYHLPHHYPQRCVAYTGTHDNATLLEWYKGLSRKDKVFVKRYCRINSRNPVNDIIETVFQSVANLVIVPIQDYLALGGEARINIPSTVGDNWKWRLKKGQFKRSTQKRIAQITGTYFR
ncbi:MAG: 4-alpha-glucanotransferase [Acetivibrionales bacterium]|jgi:4-alpha-glucanotransferase|nr:4-alpha-glucanotransferase [Clostridiaceae bacterium]